MYQVLEFDPRQQDLFADWPTVDQVCPRIPAGAWANDCSPSDDTGHSQSLAAPSVACQRGSSSPSLKVGQLVVIKRSRRLCKVCAVHSDGSASLFYMDSPDPFLGLGHERWPRSLISTRLGGRPPRL